MSISFIERPRGEAALGSEMRECVQARRSSGRGVLWLGKWLAALVLAAPFLYAQEPTGAQAASAAAQPPNRPPRVVQAERFLAQRGIVPGRAAPGDLHRRAKTAAVQPQAQGQSSGTASWTPLGPVAVQSQSFGLVTGRVPALALDPSDATGNTLYAGTTGGGVWLSQNADTSNPANIVFTPLTDDLPALSGAQDASISIGALSVQPGGTGVILAGTGDPNDALDSYYGAGILRSADGGITWTLIPSTTNQTYSFAGEGLAGFAWSTANQQLVVAAVSQAYEGTLVNAGSSGVSYEGLYYSSDSGATWTLATITDGAGEDVQGPNDRFVLPDGNAATSVVWNPVRQLFVAAVRYHGYYQSADGITFTRMAAQPGQNLMAGAGYCPTDGGATGSPDCPIFRGALAVNPQTGDTFAWTVDIDNQDQGVWQDQCSVSAGACASPAIAFGQQWDTTALETDTALGSATIENGDYNLALAAVPSGQGTMLLAGANDLWQTNCPVAQGCVWRNTTNSTTCMSAQVGEYQHALAWNPSNPLEVFLGNDSGLWRSGDGINESSIANPEPVCAPTDASHFQNLNGSLGSLAEVESLSQVGVTPYTMMAGLGANGTGGVRSTTGPTADWPEILGGEGGPVAIDPSDISNWYVNNQAGVSIYTCSQLTPCTPAAFGASPAVSDADVGGDGLTMTAPAPFLVDPLAASRLLIGTCRVWRGTANGVDWTGANAISPILDGATGNSYCSGDALIRSMAAMALTASAALPDGGEIIYVGMYGSADGGETLPGHVLSATFNPFASTPPAWTDLTPASSSTSALNHFGLDISSIFIDPHDPTGQTVYVTVAGIHTATENLQTVYGSTDGGAQWTGLMSNLPAAPANGLVVDPQDANTVYVATDAGVYSTRQISSCAGELSTCWSAFGSGLPDAPVVALSAAPASAAVHDLVAATYGRGIWIASLWTAAEDLTTSTASPVSLTFASQVYGTSSKAQTVTVKNTGSIALTPTSVAASGDFSETDNCQGEVVAAGASCAIQVTFTPTQTGSRSGALTIAANITGGELAVSLSGTGTASGAITLSPATASFGGWEVGTTSTPLQVTANNSGSPAISFTSAVSGPFAIASNACGSSIPATGSCTLTLTFTPLQAGAATGTLTFTDADGTQTVALSGTGQAPPTDALSPASIAFSGTDLGQLSAAQTVTLSNSGGVALTSIAVTVSGAFQQTNQCGASLAANSSCAISVVYAPSLAGSQTGALSVADALRTQTVALTGTGLQPPALGVSPASLSFTAQTVGQASLPQTVTVSNTGGASLANVGFQISGLSASSFTTGTTTCGATLASSASCTVQVIFTPAAAGGSTASLAVSSSTTGVQPASVALTGNGQTSAGLNVSPAQLVFPIIEPGQSSPAQTINLTNTGGSAANSLTLTATPPFSLTQNTCASALAAGTSCSAALLFSPPLNGPYTGTLTIASPSLAASASVALSGTGGTPGTVEALPSLVNFTGYSGGSEIGVGLLSSPVTVTFTNPGGAASLSNFALAVTAGFKLVNNACPATLASGASCTAGVEFAPSSAGERSGSLTVSSSALPTGAFVPLSGMGFDFAIEPSGSSSQAIANGQTADFALTITPLLGSQGVFTLQCGSLPPYASCTINPGAEGVPANTTGNELVEIATGLTQTSARTQPPSGRPLARPSAWPVLPLVCGIILLPFALRRRSKALLLILVLAVLAAGVSSCTESSIGISSIPPKSGSGITPVGTYTIPVTAISNGVQHQVTLTLTVD